jgi:hypothetical protein
MCPMTDPGAADAFLAVVAGRGIVPAAAVAAVGAPAAVAAPAVVAVAVVADGVPGSAPICAPDRLGVPALFAAACWPALPQNPVSRNTRSTRASARRAAIDRSSPLPHPRAC